MNQCVSGPPPFQVMSPLISHSSVKRMHNGEAKIDATTRPKSETNRDLIISIYKKDLESVWYCRLTTKQVWYQEEPITLDCKALDEEVLPRGFTRVQDNRYQYNFTDPESIGSRRYRPVAYRMPFLKNSAFYDKTMTVSHLCHNNWCYNWEHHTFETLDQNKARNGCPGGPSCRHTQKCIIPGRYSQFYTL